VANSSKRVARCKPSQAANRSSARPTESLSRGGLVNLLDVDIHNFMHPGDDTTSIAAAVTVRGTPLQ